MMPDAAVWLRWALYVDLAAAFGAPFTALLLGDRRAGGRALAGACIVGVGLSALGFGVTLARMAGTGLGDLDPALVSMMLTGSALGWSVLARCAALFAGAGLAMMRAPKAMVACAALAVGSLAWGGHAAASQGSLSAIRLGGDIAHLLAGLTWLGAIMLFVVQILRARPSQSTELARLARRLGAFAGIGTVLVGALVISGIGNLLFLGSPSAWLTMAASPYGRLILAKLALFAGMLALAAHNRFRLVPALLDASGPMACQNALSALRASLCAEGALGLAVVWCVAFAGTLDPMGAV